MWVTNSDGADLKFYASWLQSLLFWFNSGSHEISGLLQFMFHCILPMDPASSDHPQGFLLMR